MRPSIASVGGRHTQFMEPENAVFMHPLQGRPVLEITFDNRKLSRQYTECLDKFLFIRTNCPDTREPVKILLAMVAEACSSKENGGEVGV